MDNTSQPLLHDMYKVQYVNIFLFKKKLLMTESEETTVTLCHRHLRNVLQKYQLKLAC